MKRIIKYTVAPIDLADFRDDTLEGLIFHTNEDKAYNLLDKLEKTSTIALDVFEIELDIRFV